jgi:hypothetical protein
MLRPVLRLAAMTVAYPVGAPKILRNVLMTAKAPNKQLRRRQRVRK